MLPGAVSIKMSVEDLTLDRQSDSEDLGTKKKVHNPCPLEDAYGDGSFGDLVGGENDVLYLELSLLFNNLKSFQRIYDNNALIDLEVRTSIRKGTVRASPHQASHQHLNDGVF